MLQLTTYNVGHTLIEELFPQQTHWHSQWIRLPMGDEELQADKEWGGPFPSQSIPSIWSVPVNLQHHKKVDLDWCLWD